MPGSNYSDDSSLAEDFLLPAEPAEFLIYSPPVTQENLEPDHEPEAASGQGVEQESEGVDYSGVVGILPCQHPNCQGYVVGSGIDYGEFEGGQWCSVCSGVFHPSCFLGHPTPGAATTCPGAVPFGEGLPEGGTGAAAGVADEYELISMQPSPQGERKSHENEQLAELVFRVTAFVIVKAYGNMLEIERHRQLQA